MNLPDNFHDVTDGTADEPLADMPPQDAEPGDVWGAYSLGADGWWWREDALDEKVIPYFLFEWRQDTRLLSLRYNKEKFPWKHIDLARLKDFVARGVMSPDYLIRVYPVERTECTGGAYVTHFGRAENWRVSDVIADLECDEWIIERTFITPEKQTVDVYVRRTRHAARISSHT